MLPSMDIGAISAVDIIFTIEREAPPRTLIYAHDELLSVANFNSPASPARCAYRAYAQLARHSGPRKLPPKITIHAY